MAFYGTMQFADDVVGQFEASFVAPQRQALEVVGDEAVLMAFAPWRTDWPGELRVIRANGSDVVPVPSVDAYVLELENMADAVAGVPRPYSKATTLSARHARSTRSTAPPRAER